MCNILIICLKLMKGLKQKLLQACWYTIMPLEERSSSKFHSYCPRSFASQPTVQPQTLSELIYRSSEAFTRSKHYFDEIEILYALFYDSLIFFFFKDFFISRCSFPVSLCAGVKGEEFPILLGSM